MLGDKSPRTFHNFEKVAHCALAQVGYALGHNRNFKPLPCGCIYQNRDNAVCFARACAAWNNAHPRRQFPQLANGGCIGEPVNTPSPRRHNLQTTVVPL